MLDVVSGAGTFKDHFSERSGDYALYRPTYPAALFEFLTRTCSNRGLAWDCATGNGQAALSLAPFFREVVASDASERQIASAIPAANVVYRTAPAEMSGLGDRSVALITVAQALHWFDQARFFAEAKRVLADNGVLAVWGYALCDVNDACEMPGVMSRLPPCGHYSCVPAGPDSARIDPADERR
ncbi:MAG: class I SAM-dependent methyltransferase [Woeseiaceae bacterium]